MSFPAKGFRRLGLQGKFSLTFFAIALLVAAVISAAVYRVESDYALSVLRLRLANIVGVGAANLDGDLHRSLSFAAGTTSEPYRRLQATFQSMLASVPDLDDVYSMRADASGGIRFAVDAEDDPERAVPLGGLYTNASDLLRANFATLDAPLVETEFYTDPWGTWLSAYAPIRASDGTRVGVFGADISAEVVRSYGRSLIWLTMGVFLSTLPLILLSGWWMGRVLTRPIATLTDGAERIAGGDLSVRLNSARNDEIGTLARAFDRMAERLMESRIRIEESAARYRGIFEYAAEGIFQTTLDGKVVTVNPALRRMLGDQTLSLDLTEVGGLGERFYARSEDRERLLAEVRERGSVTGFEVELRRIDGSSFWAGISLRLVERADGPPMLEGMVSDHTDRRQRQQAETEREAARLASEAKSGFLANMSHEIRTPLNAVMGLTDLVLRTELDQRQRDYLSKARIAAKSLLSVINDILDFSKIEAGRLELESAPFSLDEVLANLTEMFAYGAHEKEIELIVSADAQVPRALIGDSTRIGQILINLTSNAIKFTDRGEVMVSVDLVDPPPPDLVPEQTMLRIQVRDTGAGIPEDRLSAIFESFSQADQTITRRHGGTGLGLAIARDLSRLMGGDLSVASRLDEGSTFTATLVLGRQPERQQHMPTTPLDLRGLKVLVVDDNATSREILVGQLESFQMSAQAAASGEEALALMSDPAHAFDLVLMDWKMPGMNGLETTRRLRADLKLDKTPVVCMVSAYAREDLMQPAERSILDAFLNKPVNQSFLFDTIMGLFGHQDAAVTGAPLQRGVQTDTGLPDFTGRRVLLVEDIEMNRLVAIEWLTSAGFEVKSVENGLQAVSEADPARYDVILMDLQMPVMDGLEATRRIRANPEKAGIPIIAMTAHALKGDLERCLNAGMNDYVAKPIDPDRLFAALARWVNPSGRVTPGVPDKTPDVEVSPDEGLSRLHFSGIDVAMGLARANQNSALYLKLLRGFVSAWGETLVQTREDLSAGRLEEARRRIHSVKGVAGNIGAVALYEAAQIVEQRIASGGGCDADSDDWRNLAVALNEVLDGLSALPGETVREPVASGAEAEMSGDALKEAIVELSRLLDEDLAQARDRLDRLHAPLERRFGSERLQSILDQIEDFDIDAAIETLHTLAEELDLDRTG
ncbi:multi-sensor hybrid histidine kinase [Thiorhodococcus drewsii AZ1]|uniref:Sensory/regulatory protein RpfC n=1 Tax=Thiorhodococcus drewsii AZ1 TaxID=765913 RepID=G2E1Z9_9GAMM|nr:response regulator [Thiorhodococcus drewsii]EGV30948.1 multi-sensor hybrid histidine kinase [Thiorhodococcus drewsii AZ1]